MSYAAIGVVWLAGMIGIARIAWVEERKLSITEAELEWMRKRSGDRDS